MMSDFRFVDGESPVGRSPWRRCELNFSSLSNGAFIRNNVAKCKRRGSGNLRGI